MTGHHKLDSITMSHLHGPTPQFMRPKDNTHLWGWGLLFAAFCFFTFFFYTTVFAKFVPETGFAVLDFFRNDWYYCLLLPMLIPVTVFSAYLNWLGMKFFRHT
jgi:hypothetical protein